VGGILPGFTGGVRRPSPVAQENPLKALIFLDFISGLVATRQTELATRLRPRRADDVFSLPVISFKTAAYPDNSNYIL
jgi:hypothetical protein